MGVTMEAALNAVQTTRVAQVGAYALLMYDVLCTFRAEVAILWPTRWTLPKVCFMFARYLGLTLLLADAIMTNIIDPTSSVCNGWAWFSTMAKFVLLSVIINFLLALRLYALWGRTRWVSVVLGIVYFTELGFELAGPIVGHLRPLLVPSLTGGVVQACVASYDPRWVGAAIQGVCLVRSSLAFGLAAYKWFSFLDYEPTSGVGASTLRRRIRRTRSLGPLLSCFVRDEAAVFLIITVMQAILAFVNFTPGFGMYGTAAYQMFTAAMCIIACRLVLNLHAQLASDHDNVHMLSVPVPHSGGRVRFNVEMQRETPASTGLSADTSAESYGSVKPGTPGWSADSLRVPSPFAPSWRP